MIISEEEESIGSSSNLTHRPRRPVGVSSSATVGASFAAEGAGSREKPVKGQRKYLGNHLFVECFELLLRLLTLWMPVVYRRAYEEASFAVDASGLSGGTCF